MGKMIELLKMIKKKHKRGLPRPKITLDRLGQIVFTFKEVTKLTLKIQPKLLITAFILNAVWGFSAVPGFFLEKLIIDKLIESVGAQNLQPVLYSVGFLVVLALLLSLLRNFLSSYNNFLRRTMSRHFEAELGVIIGQKLSELDMVAIDSPEFQDRFSKIEKESGRRAWGLMMPMSDIPNYLVGFISSVGVLMFLHPLIAFGVFIVSLPQIFIDSKYIRRGYELYTENSILRRVWRWLDMYLVRNRNFMELKLLNLSNYLSNKLRKIVKTILNREFELNRKREVSRFGSLIPLTFFELGVSLLLIFWVVVKKITVGSFQLYLRSLRSAQQNLTGLVSSFLEIYENYIYINDLVWFLNLEPNIKSTKDSVSVEAIRDYSIELDNVWFKYQKEHPWVIKGVDLKIESGERIALVGENGAGKSTLIKLLTRFYDPQKGRLLADGNDLKELDVSGWRDIFAVLFQQFEEYPFSVKESIGFGDIKRIKEVDGIKQAAKETGIDRYIEDLPLKFDNPLSPRFEKGVRPSAGQWQRIAISRVLFKKDAKILILDEPTSNVDPEAEEAIFKELVKKTKNKVLIFVTQRFSTVRVADRILVMHGGKIIEQGSHTELMKKNGKYARLFTLQAQTYLNSP